MELRNLVWLLLLAAAFGQTTTNLKMNLPAQGTPNWDVLLNQNFSLLDAGLPYRVAANFVGADCGAKINAADADLGSFAGEIQVSQACGTAWTTGVTLSANHLLRFTQCGTYTVTHAIVLSGNASGILGPAQTEGSGLCTIQAANGANLDTIVSMPGNGTVLRDVTIDGNRTNSGTSGLTASAVVIPGAGGRQDITAVTVQNSSGSGLKVAGGCCLKIEKLFAFQNANDGLFCSNTSDGFVADSEFESNLLNGTELADCPAWRIIHSDYGSNGQSGGKGIYAYGTAAGAHSNQLQLYSNQFGNDYQEDLYIVGYDTQGNARTAIQGVVGGNVFNGSPNRTPATYAAVKLIDGYQFSFVNNFFNNGNSLTLDGILFTETAVGRSTPSSIVGNCFNQNFSKNVDDSTLQSRANFIPAVNCQFDGGYLRDTQTTLTANYNSGTAKVIYVPTTAAVLKISGVEAINRAATTSSTMPSLTLGWTDPGGIARTQTLVATSSGNATTVLTNFTTVIQTDGATNVTLTSASYASSGATSMQYELAYSVERLQ